MDIFTHNSAINGKLMNKEQRMQIKLIFNFWEENCPELSEGNFHSGTTFNGVICLNNEDAAELTAALKQGYTPVFSVMLEEGGEAL